jgi:DNA-binding NtrC family response regulator
VLKASTAEDAVTICKESRLNIDLLIVDVMMPKMSGMQIVNRIHKICPDTKVLYMSGYSNQIISKQGILEPGYDFIQKPFTAIRLLRMARQTLDRSAFNTAH